MIVFEFVDEWPEPVRPADESPPPPTFCEVNIAPENRLCGECVPGLFVCPAHFVACGGECLICCFFCWRALCNHHAYCPCADAVNRRRDVALAKRDHHDAPPVRGARAVSSSSHICRPPEAPKPVFIPRSPLVASLVPVIDEPSSPSIARCLSPGPRFDGPTPDPSTIWPLSEYPDWPISDDLRDFAFDTVVLSTRPSSPSHIWSS